METKDRELLLKDLCARLPYGVRVKSSRRKKPVTLSLDIITDFHLGCTVKPYLRPMESMTKEEAKTFVTLWGIEDFISLDVTKEYIGVVSDDGFSSTVTTEIWYDGDMPISCYDFLNACHLDYRGLIPMGLASPAPDGMYNFK